jgi:hypothetical protein
MKPSDFSLCTNKNDPFLEEKTIWVAELSDGTKIYQDDDRKGLEEHSAWIRLGDYLRHIYVCDTQLTIRRIQLMFRDHIINLPINKLAYFFSKGMVGVLSGKSTRFFVVGHVSKLKQNYMMCKWYHVPSLEISRISKKAIADIETPQIIWNYDGKEP